MSMIKFKDFLLSRLDQNFVLFFAVIVKICSSTALLCGIVCKKIDICHGSMYTLLIPWPIIPARYYQEFPCLKLIDNLDIPFPTNWVGRDPECNFQVTSGTITNQWGHQKKTLHDLNIWWIYYCCIMNLWEATILCSKCMLFQKLFSSIIKLISMTDISLIQGFMKLRFGSVTNGQIFVIFLIFQANIKICKWKVVILFLGHWKANKNEQEEERLACVYVRFF